MIFTIDQWNHEIKNNDIETKSANNKAKSVVAERFTRSLKNKMYKYMTSLSKNAYIGKLNDIVNEYNNTYHRTIKMNPADVKSSTYIDFGLENNDKDPKINIGDHVRKSKHNKIFWKGYVPNWSEEVSVIKKVKNTVPWT